MIQDPKDNNQVFDVQLIDKLITEKKMFKKQLEQFGSNLESNIFTTYYLLSTKFIEEWKVYSGYDPNNILLTPSSGSPPQPFNEDISTVEQNVVQLKNGLMRHKDFEIVSPDLMAIFREHYTGNLIQKRIVRRQSGDKVLQIYQIKFQYFFISQSIVKQIDCGPKHSSIKLEEAEISRYLTLAQLKNACMKIFQNSNKAWEAEDARIWRLDKEVTIKDYYDMIKAESVTQTPNRYFISSPKSVEFEKESVLIEDLKLQPSDIVMIEIREVDKDWIVRDEDSDGLCPTCQLYLPLRVRGSDRLSNYCSKQCKPKTSEQIVESVRHKQLEGK